MFSFHWRSHRLIQDHFSAFFFGSGVARTERPSRFIRWSRLATLIRWARILILDLCEGGRVGVSPLFPVPTGRGLERSSLNHYVNRSHRHHKISSVGTLLGRSRETF